MITAFFARRAERRRERRSRTVDTILQRLGRENFLVVNDMLIARAGVGRHEFFQVVYSLVMQERMHMMTDSEGEIVLMSNAEYHRFLLRRSGVRETEIRLRENVPVFSRTVSERAIPAAEEDTVVVDAVQAELETLAVGGEGSLDWFSLDVAPTPAAREKVPAVRQSLPERRREAWLAGEAAADEM